MDNTSEALLLIEKELKLYVPILSEASQSILDNEISNYPIFVAHKEDIKIGIPVIDRHTTKANWSVEASTLEEFVAKNLIHHTKLDEFKSTYKNPEQNVCVFLLSSIGAQFLFMPIS